MTHKTFPFSTCLRPLLLALLCLLPQASPGEADTLIQLLNNPIEDVLATYEELTGKQVLREASLPTTTISINVTEPVPRKTAIELIESSLLLNGFAIVPGPGNSLKVVSLLSGKNPRSQGLQVFSKPEELPDGEQLVSYLMRLQFLSAEEAQTIFSQHFAPTQPYGSVVAVPSTNALLITESAKGVAEMIGLQQLIDTPPPDVQAHFVTLTRANADRVVETIQKIFSGSGTQHSGGQTGQSAQSGQGQSAQATRGAQLFGGLGKSSPVEFASDKRTNRVIVICPPHAAEFYENFVLSFDVAADAAPAFEFQLRYVAVGEVLPALAKALREGQDKESDADPDKLAEDKSPGNSASTGSTATGGDPSNVLGQVQEQSDRNLPITITVGNTRLIADQRNNTIIALAPPESLDRITTVIDYLDKAPMQVYLSIVIVEMDVTNDLQYGVDFLLKGSEGIIGSNQRGQPLTLAGLLNPAGLLTPESIISGTSGLSMFGTFGTALDVLVTALESSSRVKVLGRPTVYTSNNKKAVISVGEQIPVPQTTVSTVNPNENSSTALTSTIEYKDVLLQLEVVPLVNSNNEVTLEIAQKNDELGRFFNIAGSDVQSVRTQQIKTSVTVPNKHTVVLGGLITDREESTKQQIPILGDIPLIGLAFQGTKTTNTRKELLLLIQPQIVQGDRDLFNVNALEKKRVSAMDQTAEVFVSPPLPSDIDLPPDAELVPFTTEPPKRRTPFSRKTR